jgi:hypothetical protein
MQIALKGRPWKRRWQKQAAVIAAAMLALSIGLCLVHNGSEDMGHHATSPKLCTSAIMILVPPMLLTRPVANGWLVSAPARSFHSVSPDLPDRPPESLSLA